jgi:hypothetical protein
MPKIEKLKIFLASPADVARERKSVHSVVDELNQTTAPALDITLEVIDSTRAFPGLGKDGQAIINEQLGDMQEYALMVVIFWKRIGTPTRRDISGTVEELNRAIKNFRRKRKPAIWIYFSNAPFNPTTPDDIKQKAGVIDLKSKLRGKGLWHDYENAASFATHFRKHLTTWLHARHAKATARRKPVRAIAQPAPKAESTLSAMSPDRAIITPTGAAARPLPARKSTRATSVAGRSPGIVKDPSPWVMLNQHFYQADRTARKGDRSIELQIVPATLEQAHDIQSLHPGEFQARRHVVYADKHEVGNTFVQSVTSESRGKDTVFTILLAPLPQVNRGGITEFSFNAYSADTIAELRARLILLGQPLPKELEHIASSYQTRSAYSASMLTSIRTLPQLWASLGTQPRLFLPQAWLYTAYLLKTESIVESILALELGPIKAKKMRVKFRGRRARLYDNHEPVIVNIEGECILED